MISVILLNAIGSVFVLYLIIHAIRITSVRKKCKPIHKRPFSVERFNKSRKNRVVILSIIGLYGLWLYGILTYEPVQLFLLYFAAITGLTTYFPLFKQGKVGQDGIAISDTFISWQDVEHAEFIAPTISDTHYPNHTLSLSTKHGFCFRLIVDKEDVTKITPFLTEKERT